MAIFAKLPNLAFRRAKNLPKCINDFQCTGCATRLPFLLHFFCAFPSAVETAARERRDSRCQVAVRTLLRYFIFSSSLYTATGRKHPVAVPHRGAESSEGKWRRQGMKRMDGSDGVEKNRGEFVQNG